MSTIDYKIISEYTHMPFSELVELDVITYRQLLHDAVVYNLEQTEEGKDYLEQCWILKQTRPDYKRLKEKQNNA